MTVYLDQNILIELTKDNARLASLQKILGEGNFHVGISIAHVCETAKISDLQRRDKVMRVVNALPTLELAPLIPIVQCEILNEFHRFRGSRIRKTMAVSGNFGPDFEGLGFRDLVSLCSLSSERVRTIWQHDNDYQRHNDRLRQTHGALTRENITDELLDFGISYLDPKNLSLPIHPAPKSLDRSKFKKEFAFGNCPYLDFIREFQWRRLSNPQRKPQSGDLSDTEHATHGAMTCDVVVIENFSREMIEQIARTNTRVKAKPFSALNEAIAYLENLPSRP